MMRVAVRTLCEFAARSGDLDHRYTPSPNADEGIAGHARVRARRGAHYATELPLAGECEGLALSGRADGYDTRKHCLEEIKTHRGDLSRLSAAQQAQHWAQLRAYGALLCASEGLDAIELALVYYDVGRDRETRLTEQANAATLWELLATLCRVYRRWAEQEEAHRAARDAALAGLRFPFGDFRRGQRALAETVYKTVCTGRHLLLQAPTGLGKTAGTLFPALMAMPRQGLDRVFYLTARNTGRQLALDGLARIRDGQEAALPLRVLELPAKEHACEHPDLACHGESCPLAKGFFDRLAEARHSAANSAGFLDRDRLREAALAHQICPYYLGQEMARWADVVIGDVNRYFDQQALLYALTQQNDWKTVLLIDEAHNLIGRARGMYSTEFTQQRVLAVKRRAPAALKRSLGKLARQWSSLVARHELTVRPDQTTGSDKSPCRSDFSRESLDGAPDMTAIATEVAPTSTGTGTGVASGGIAQREAGFIDLPAELTLAALGVITAISEYLADEPADLELQELLFEAIRYVRLAECFGDHSLCELDRHGRGRAVLAIRNLIPADFLAPRFASAHSTILFSATLAPAHYRRDLLGLPPDTLWQDIESPFGAHQLQVRLETSISTRLADREASVQPIAALMAAQYREHPGNYLAYFSSFAYLEAVHAGFLHAAPQVPTWHQSRGMSPQARQAFIDRFVADGEGIGFAVLGGAFAEGIDLPGRRLVGAFIATLGLPPFDAWHEILRERLEQRFGRGYDYAYLYPGLQKVAQAAGRVIRTPEDQGVVILIDERFARPDVVRLLPGWWFGGAPRDR